MFEAKVHYSEKCLEMKDCGSFQTLLLNSFRNLHVFQANYSFLQFWKQLFSGFIKPKMVKNSTFSLYSRAFDNNSDTGTVRWLHIYTVQVVILA